MTRFIFIIILSFLLVYFFVFYSTISVNDRTGQMFELNKELNQLEMTLVASNENLGKYLDTKDSDSFIAYLDSRREIEAFVERYDKGLSYDQTKLKLTNISQMLKVYLDEAEYAIDNKRGRFTSEYIQAYETIQDVTGYIEKKINAVNLSEIEVNLANYNNLTDSIRQLSLLFLLVTGILVVMSLVYIYDSTEKIIYPIEHLSEQSKEIAKGNYGAVEEGETYFTEAVVLQGSFSEMARSIKSYIEDIQDKATTENKLRISEIKNLRMENIVKEAELKALQSQINPHFLYNTLNAGVGLAEYEEAERTSDYLDHLAKLFRYNLKGLEQEVTLRDELGNIENYVQLMKVRFSDSIIFDFHVDENLLNLKMPPLILQPLVENAFIHGFRDMGTGRRIEISVRKDGPCATIEVVDNGSGMSPEQLDKILQRSSLEIGERSVEHEEHGHTTGLGMDNVKSRLELFYDASGVFEIDSVEGEGTKITIKIPIEVNHD